MSALVERCEAIAGRGLGRHRCRRTARFTFEGKMFCRTHCPELPSAVIDVDEDLLCHFCACGCGQQANPWYAIFATLARDGFTHQQIAARFGFQRPFVSHLIRYPSKYVRGHNTAGYWASEEGMARRTNGLQLNGRGVLSLDAPLGGVYNGITRHELIAARSVDDIAIEDERRRHLYQIVGEMDPDDVRLLDEQTLERLQDRLREAGLTPRGTDIKDRRRIQAPARHSGVAITKAPLIPGRKTRRQKIAHKAANRSRGNSNRPPQQPRKRWERQNTEDSRRRMIAIRSLEEAQS